MENVFKLTPPLGIGKDNLAKARPVGASLRIEGLWAKGGGNGLSDAVVCSEQVVRAVIGVKELCRQYRRNAAENVDFPVATPPVMPSAGTGLVYFGMSGNSSAQSPAERSSQ